MALVTYLRSLDHEPRGTKWDKGQCCWIFLQTDELTSEVLRFTQDEALVNPRQFNKLFARTKGELHAHSPSPA